MSTQLTCERPETTSAASLRPESMIELFFHKLSQPIGALSACLEVACLSDDPADLKAGIERGLSQVDRLLWYFSVMRRFFAEDFTANSQPTSVQNSLKTVIENCAPLADAGGVKLAFGQTDESFVVVNGPHFQQSLENVVATCLRNSPPEATLAIQIEKKQAEIHIMIPDFTPYSAADNINCFNPFPPGVEVNADNTATLDLALSQRIISCFGGRIELIASKEGNRVFDVSLPLAPRPAGQIL